MSNDGLRALITVVLRRDQCMKGRIPRLQADRCRSEWSAPGASCRGGGGVDEFDGAGYGTREAEGPGALHVRSPSCAPRDMVVRARDSDVVARQRASDAVVCAQASSLTGIAVVLVDNALREEVQIPTTRCDMHSVI
jgi:hypothetical protein